MPGHIRKRGKRSWAVVVDYGQDPLSGKRRRVWRSVKGTKKEAEAVLVQILHERDTGIDQPVGRMTVAEYLQRWLADYAQPNTAPATYVQYEYLVRRHAIPRLGAISLTKLRPRHIQACYSDMLASGRVDGGGRLSPRTVTALHRVLREALHHAVRWQLMNQNVADAVDPPRVERREQPVLDLDAVQRLLAAAEERGVGALIYLAVMTGMRRGELLGLRWADIDLEGRVLHLRRALQRLGRQGVTFREPKASSHRAIALSTETVARLHRHRREQLEHRLALGPVYADHDLVFATALGEPIDPSNLRRSWLCIRHEAGCDELRLHDLRHLHATLMLAQGTHAKVVSERLGHSSVRVTLDTYTSVPLSLQAEAAEGLDQLVPAIAG